MTELTPMQTEVLDAIRRFTRLEGYPPTVREIGESVGLTSPSTVHAHLTALIRKGHLHRDPTKPRTIIVTGEPVGCGRCLRLQGEVDRLTMEREENREVIGELEAELRSLRPSPGDVR
jgi:SOS-response transcriptional repressor LexA